MIKNYVYLGISALLLSSCGYTKTAKQTTNQGVDQHNSRISLDWSGVYKATLPCADCPGIKATLILNENDTFKSEWKYLERYVKIVDSGDIKWQKGDNTIQLIGKETKEFLQVGEMKLISLDQNGKPITGAIKDQFIYRKVLPK